jgi:hypothetical protein
VLLVPLQRQVRTPVSLPDASVSASPGAVCIV